MMRSCSISGVPRTTHTMVLTRYFSGLKTLRLPNEMISPSGIAPMSVKTKISRDLKKP